MRRARPSPFLVHESQVEGKSVPTENADHPTIKPHSANNGTPKLERRQPTNQEVGKAAGATVGTAHTPEGTPIVQSRDESMLPRSEPSTPVKPAVESSAPVLGAAVSGTQSSSGTTVDGSATAPEPCTFARFSDRAPALNTQGSDTKSQAPDSSRTQTTESRGPEKGSIQNTLAGAAR